MTAPNLTLLRTDNGFCRVYYRGDFSRLFCYQQSNHGSEPVSFELMVCSKDGEPSHKAQIDFYEPDKLPAGDSKTETLFREWYKGRTQL